MGRPIKKKWFTVKDGSTEGDLQVTTTSGAQPIVRQKGTGVYDVSTGRVKLVDGVPAAADEASLAIGGNYIRKISQYRMYFFDDAVKDVQWRDAEGNVLVVLDPLPLTEGSPVAGTISDYTVFSIDVVDPSADADITSNITFVGSSQVDVVDAALTITGGTGGDQTGVYTISNGELVSATITHFGSALEDDVLSFTL